jgi:O-antigen/teichoic acid export membrane protein
LRKLGPLAVLSSLGEGLQAALERGLVASYAGLSGLGIYTHSNQYRMMTHLGVKAAALSMWPTTIEEARASRPLRFPQTIALWQFVHIGLIAVGIIASSFGTDFIAALTHDKFTAAAALLPYWFVYLLIQASGKPQTGLMYANNRGRTLSIVTLLGIACWLPAIYFLVPVFGLKGGVIAMIVALTVFRGAMQVLSWRIAPTPSGDIFIIPGIVAILAIGESISYFELDLGLRTTVAVVALAVIGVAGRRPIKTFATDFLGLGEHKPTPSS